MNAFQAGSVSKFAWDIAYNSLDGAASVGFLAGAVSKTGKSNSQYIGFSARNASSAAMRGNIFMDGDGVTWMQGVSGGQIVFDVSGKSAFTAMIHPNYLIMARPIRLLKDALAGIQAWNLTSGDTAYCNDCRTTSASDNTCTTGGTGAFMVVVNGISKCLQ